MNFSAAFIDFLLEYLIKRYEQELVHCISYLETNSLESPSER
jgi:hypothetical protein